MFFSQFDSQSNLFCNGVTKCIRRDGINNIKNYNKSQVYKDPIRDPTTKINKFIN